jgi:CBS domain-containing protein
MKHAPALASVMTPFPHAIDAGDTLGHARSMMAEHDFHHLPVTRADELVGVISDTDLLVAGNLAPNGGAQVLVSAVCTRDVYVVDIHTRLDVVAKTMAERHIGSALVTRQGKLVGILTHTDVARVLGEVLSALFPGEGGDDVA